MNENLRPLYDVLKQNMGDKMKSSYEDFSVKMENDYVYRMKAYNNYKASSGDVAGFSKTSFNDFVGAISGQPAAQPQQQGSSAASAAFVPDQPSAQQQAQAPEQQQAPAFEINKPWETPMQQVAESPINAPMATPQAEDPVVRMIEGGAKRQRDPEFISKFFENQDMALKMVDPSNENVISKLVKDGLLTEKEAYDAKIYGKNPFNERNVEMAGARKSKEEAEMIKSYDRFSPKKSYGYDFNTVEKKLRDDSLPMAERINYQADLKMGYDLIKQDYLEYLKNTDNLKYEMTLNAMTELENQEKAGALGEGQQLRFRTMMQEAVIHHNKAMAARMSYIRDHINVEEYNKVSALLDQQIKSVRAEFEALKIKEGAPLTEYQRSQADEIAGKMKTLQDRAKKLEEETGITPEVQDALQKSYDSYVSEGAFLKSMEARFPELAAREKTSMDNAQRRYDDVAKGDFSHVGNILQGVFIDAPAEATTAFAKAPAILAEAFGSTRYSYLTDLYDYAEQKDLERNTYFGQPINLDDDEEKGDLPTMYKYSKLFGNALGSIATLGAGSKAIYALSGAKQGTALWISSFLQSNASSYEMALSNGADPRSAARMAVALAAVTATVESIVPDYKYFEPSAFRRSVINGWRNGTGLQQSIQGALAALPDATQTYLKVGMKEFGEEVISEYSNDEVGVLIGAKKKEDAFKIGDYLDAGIAGFMGGAGANVFSRPSRKDALSRSAFMMAVEKPKELSALLSEVNKEKAIEVSRMVTEGKVILDDLKKHPGWDKMSRNAQEFLLSEMYRKKLLEDMVKSTGIKDPEVDKEIETINNHYITLLSGKKAAKAAKKTEASPVKKEGETTGAAKPDEKKPEETVPEVTGGASPGTVATDPVNDGEKTQVATNPLGGVSQQVQTVPSLVAPSIEVTGAPSATQSATSTVPATAAATAVAATAAPVAIGTESGTPQAGSTPAQPVASKPQGTTVSVATTEEASALDDNQLYTFKYKSEEEVPEQLKPLMKTIGGQSVTVKKGRLGKSRKTTVPEKPIVVATGQQIKQAFNLQVQQPQASVEPAQPMPVAQPQQPVIAAQPIQTQSTDALKDVESTAKALEDFKNKVGVTSDAFQSLSDFAPENSFGIVNGEDTGKKITDVIAELYHKDKAASKKTELVKAVESLLSKEQSSTQKTPVSNNQSDNKILDININEISIFPYVNDSDKSAFVNVGTIEVDARGGNNWDNQTTGIFIKERIHIRKDGKREVHIGVIGKTSGRQTVAGIGIIYPNNINKQQEKNIINTIKKVYTEYVKKYTPDAISINPKNQSPKTLLPLSKHLDELNNNVKKALESLLSKEQTPFALSGEQVRNKLQEIEKQPVKINITQDANGKMEQTSKEVIDNIKEELDKTGLPYSDVISNDKGSTYFVVTKDGQQHEILKVLQSGGKLVPTNLTKAKWINHLIKTEKDGVVKAVESLLSKEQTPETQSTDGKQRGSNSAPKGGGAGVVSKAAGDTSGVDVPQEKGKKSAAGRKKRTGEKAKSGLAEAIDKFSAEKDKPASSSEYRNAAKGVDRNAAAVAEMGINDSNMDLLAKNLGSKSKKSSPSAIIRSAVRAGKSSADIMVAIEATVAGKDLQAEEAQNKADKERMKRMAATPMSEAGKTGSEKMGVISRLFEKPAGKPRVTRVSVKEKKGSAVLVQKAESKSGKEYYAEVEKVGGKWVPVGDPNSDMPGFLGNNMSQAEAAVAKRYSEKSSKPKAPTATTETDGKINAERERELLSDRVMEAKRKVANASLEDSESAMSEYNAAKKNLDEFDRKEKEAKDNKRRKANVESLVEDEVSEQEKPGYEYQDEFSKDPRLAALKRAKEMLEFVQTKDYKDALKKNQKGVSADQIKKEVEKSKLRSEKDVRDLEADIDENPVKEKSPDQKKKKPSKKKEVEKPSEPAPTPDNEEGTEGDGDQALVEPDTTKGSATIDPSVQEKIDAVFAAIDKDSNRTDNQKESAKKEIMEGVNGLLELKRRKDAGETITKEQRDVFYKKISDPTKYKGNEQANRSAVRNGLSTMFLSEQVKKGRVIIDEGKAEVQRELDRFLDSISGADPGGPLFLLMAAGRIPFKKWVSASYGILRGTAKIMRGAGITTLAQLKTKLPSDFRTLMRYFRAVGIKPKEAVAFMAKPAPKRIPNMSPSQRVAFENAMYDIIREINSKKMTPDQAREHLEKMALAYGTLGSAMSPYSLLPVGSALMFLHNKSQKLKTRSGIVKLVEDAATASDKKRRSILPGMYARSEDTFQKAVNAIRAAYNDKMKSFVERKKIITNLIKSELSKEVRKEIGDREFAKLMTAIGKVKGDKSLAKQIVKVEQIVKAVRVRSYSNLFDDLAGTKLSRSPGGRVRGTMSIQAQDILNMINTDLDKVVDKNGNFVEAEMRKALNDVVNEISSMISGRVPFNSDRFTALEVLQLRMEAYLDMDAEMSLSQANSILTQVITQGRIDHKAALDKASAVYEDAITRAEADVSYEGKIDNRRLRRMRERMANRKNGKQIINRMRRIWNSRKDFLDRHKDIDSLVAVLSKSGAGDLHNLISEPLRVAARDFMANTEVRGKMLDQAMRSIFGDNYKDVMRQVGQDLVEIPDVIDTTTGLPMVLTQNQAYYWYNLYKDEDNHKSFSKTFEGSAIASGIPDTDEAGKLAFAAKVMAQIEAQLDRRIKDFADWQTNTYYPQMYNSINEVYRKVFRTNLPKIKKYSGRIYREGVSIDDVSDMLTTGGFISSVYGGSTKERRAVGMGIMKVDGNVAIASYTNEMEHVIAYAVPINVINKILNDKRFKDAVERNGDDIPLKILTDQVRLIASRGDRSKGMGIISWLQHAVALSKLGWNAVSMIKQAGSFITASAYAPNPIEYFKYFGSINPIERQRLWKEIHDASPYMRDRYSNNYAEMMADFYKGSVDLVPSKTENIYAHAMKAAYVLTQVGDRASIWAGFIPLYKLAYDHAIKSGKSDAEAKEQAITTFEKAVKKSQQSASKEDKDITQIQGGVGRIFSMFTSAPRQQNREVINSMRQVMRAIKRLPYEGSVKQHLYKAFVMHIASPMITYWIGSGFVGLFRDDEEEENLTLIAGAVGNANSMVYFGGAIDAFMEYAHSKPYAGYEGSPVFSMIDQSTEAWAKMAKKPGWENFYEAMSKTSEITLGLPVNNIVKLSSGWKDLITGDFNGVGQGFYKFFGYSKYIQESAGKGSSGSSSGSGRGRGERGQSRESGSNRSTR